MARKRTRSEGERVYKKGRIRFFGGDARQYLHNIDEEGLLREVLSERVRLERMTGDVSVIKECEGHYLKFTQTQLRALLFHVEEVADERTIE